MTKQNPMIKLNQTQIKAIAEYLIEVSKAVMLAVLLSLLFPEISRKINLGSAIGGFLICVVFFTVGIILQGGE